MAGFKLDMYEDTVTQPLFDKLASFILRALETEEQSGYDPSSLILGQICGIEFARAQASTHPCPYHLLGSFSLSPHHNISLNYPDGYYHSTYIAAPQHSAIRHLSDLKAGSHEYRLVINQPGSFSGDILARLLCQEQALCISDTQISGSHLNSMKMVLSGEADFAAIDAISYHMALQRFPQWADQLVQIGTSYAYPGLPFICDAYLPEAVKTTICSALSDFTTQPEWAALSHHLGVTSVTAVAAEHYPPLYQLEKQLTVS